MHTLRSTTLKTALALGLGLTALGGWTAVQAQDAPVAPLANGPGPATQPPPPPGTTAPAPTQPAAPPTPPGTTAGTAPAAPPATQPPNYGIQYNGLIDGYYLFNFRNPKDSGGNPSAGHYYDIRHNSPALSLAELNVFKNAKPNGFGFKATLTVGDTADINHYGVGISTGEARFKAVQQLYGTYALGADGAGVDFGKFYTPFGYEVVEANGNYNYSRSLPFGLVPTYHAGARIYTPVPGVAGLTATFYLVNAIFNTANAGVQDDNKKPGYAGQLNYTDPKGKFVLISELALGKDKISVPFDGTTGPDAKVTLNDNNFTYNFNANMLAGLDYVYREIKRDGLPKQKTNGYAVYYRQALTPKTAAALRFSGYNDKTDGSDSAKPYEITATYELKPAANFTTRLEFRHDHSNQDMFLDKDSNLTKRDQDTLEIGGMFTF
jgi:hypothetical protein